MSNKILVQAIDREGNNTPLLKDNELEAINLIVEQIQNKWYPDVISDWGELFKKKEAARESLDKTGEFTDMDGTVYRLLELDNNASPVNDGTEHGTADTQETTVPFEQPKPILPEWYAVLHFCFYSVELFVVKYHAAENMHELIQREMHNYPQTRGRDYRATIADLMEKIGVDDWELLESDTCRA